MKVCHYGSIVLSLLVFVACDPSATRSTIPKSTNPLTAVETKKSVIEKGSVCDLKLLNERKMEKVFVQKNAENSPKLHAVFRKYDEKKNERSSVKTIDGEESVSLAYYKNKGDDLYVSLVPLTPRNGVNKERLLYSSEVEIVYDARLEDFRFTKINKYLLSNEEVEIEKDEYAEITNCEDKEVSVYSEN